MSAGICPHPPLLIPDIAAAEFTDVAELRAACLSALDSVRAASPQILYLVGTGPTTGRIDREAVGDFGPWGADLRVRLPATPRDGDLVSEDDDPAVLPLSVAVGTWLAGRREWTAPLRAVSVAADADERTCLRLGAELADAADRVTLLVMSDGSARRSDEGPRPYDARAEAYDSSVVESLRSGEPASLLAIDADLARIVSAEGLGPLLVLAGAAGEFAFDTDVLYEAAPYGVGYYVAVWERHG